MAREMKNSGIEWIGEIPANWNTNTAFQLFTQVKNKNTDLQEQNLLSLSYGKIKRKDIDTTEGLLPKSFDGYNIIEANDIVLRLTDLQNDHKSLRVGISNERGIVTSAYLTIRNRSKSLPKYLYYYLHSFDIAKGFYGMGAGVRQGLNWDGIKWLKILTPPVSEQARIANFLDAECVRIDEVIEKTRASIEEYKKLKQSVITEAVTKGIRNNRPMKDSGIEWIGEIPAEWTTPKMGAICLVITDYVASGSFASLAENVQYLDEPDYAMLVRTADVSDKGYSPKQVYINQHSYEFLSNSNLFGGELIFPNIGASVGDVYIVPVLYERMSLAPNAIMVKTNHIDRYYYYYFQSKPGRLSIEDIAQSTAQAKFNKTDFRQLRVLLPSDQEQQEIVGYLDKEIGDVDILIKKKEQIITELETYKKSLIFEYVTGKKEVKT